MIDPDGSNIQLWKKSTKTEDTLKDRVVEVTDLSNSEKQKLGEQNSDSEFEMRRMKKYWRSRDEFEDRDIKNKDVVTLSKPRRDPEQKSCNTTGFRRVTNIEDEKLKGKSKVPVISSDLNVVLANKDDDIENQSDSEKKSNSEFEVGRLKQYWRSRDECEDSDNITNKAVVALSNPRCNTEQNSCNTAGFPRGTDIQEEKLKGKSNGRVISSDLNVVLANKENDIENRSDSEKNSDSEFEVGRLKQFWKSKDECEDVNYQRNNAAASFPKSRRNTEHKSYNTTGFTRGTDIQQVILKGNSDLPIINSELNMKLATELNDAESSEKEKGSTKANVSIEAVSFSDSSRSDSKPDSQYKVENAKVGVPDFHSFEAGIDCNIKDAKCCQQPDHRDIDIEVSISCSSENFSRHIACDASVMVDTIPAITEKNTARTWYSHLSVGTVVTALLTTGLAVTGMYFVNETFFFYTAP